MRHARPEDLDRLEPLLGRLRRQGGLREKSRGVFYLGSKAFLHFHEDNGELFADIRAGDDFARVRATTASDQADLLVRVAATLGEG